MSEGSGGGLLPRDTVLPGGVWYPWDSASSGLCCCPRVWWVGEKGSSWASWTDMTLSLQAELVKLRDPTCIGGSSVVSAEAQAP